METFTIICEVLILKGLKPKSITELLLNEAVIEMISNGYGVSVMARWAVKPYIEQEKVFPVKVTKKGLLRNHYTAMLKGRQQPVFLNSFLTHLKNNMVNA